MFDGLTLAQEDYSQELEARRNAEAEISRLKIELSRHAARITAMTGEERRREVHEQLQKDLSDNVQGLERDLSKLKVDRDMTLAEVEELSASKRWALMFLCILSGINFGIVRNPMEMCPVRL